MRKIILLFFIVAAVEGQAQNVGIGTTTPKAKLHITGPSSNQTPALWLNSADATDYTSIKMSSPSAPGKYWLIRSGIKPDINDLSNMLYFFRVTDSATGLGVPSIVINNSGNVGIGTFAPVAPLSLPPSLGKKISLYPGPTGDVGFAVFGNELRQYIDDANGNITFGFDNYTNGFTERMRIKGNGNVGIGIVDPLAKLDIRGQILLRGDGTQGNSPAVFFTDVNGDQFRGKVGKHPTNDSLIGLWGFDAPNNGWALNMNIYNGRIGIGTDNATAALHVADSSVLFSGPATFSPSTIINPPVQGPGSRMMWYAQKGAFRAGLAFGTEWDRDNIGNLSFAAGYNARASGAQSFALGTFVNALGTHSTALGVNTLASGYASIAMGWATSASGRFSTATGENTLTKARNSFTSGQWNDNNDNPNADNAAPTDRIFQIGNGTADNARSNAITVLRNGNTGIGIVDPSTNFHIKSTSGNPVIIDGGPNLYVTLVENGLNRGYIGSYAGNEEDVELGTYGSNIAGAVHLTTSNVPRLTVINNGNVGIGTASPSQKLHVIGDILATGTITPSDIRYKKNIETISSPLAKLQQLQGVTYRFNLSAFPEWKFDNKLQYGLIAQEVEKVFPEMVKTIDEKGYKGVEYVKLIPVLLEAIKELNSKMELLEKENKEMKTLLQQLLKNK